MNSEDTRYWEDSSVWISTWIARQTALDAELIVKEQEMFARADRYIPNVTEDGLSRALIMQELSTQMLNSRKKE